jgi:hypothetical protein
MDIVYEEKVYGDRTYIKAGKKFKWVLRSRFVWEMEHGTIPRGYVIHHINENKLDDRLENLQMMKAFDHKSYHSSRMVRPPEWRAMMSRINKGSGNGMAKAIGSLNPAARAVVNLDTGEVFDTVRAAGIKYKCQPANISAVTHGRRARAGGHKWGLKGV